MPKHPTGIGLTANRTGFIGGSDARIIMGDDEVTLLRLWREKRAEIEPEDLSGNLLVMNLASNTAPVASTRPSSVAAIHLSAGCRTFRWISVSN